MKLDQLFKSLDSFAQFAELLNPLLSKLPADALSKIVSAAVYAVDKIGADELVNKAQSALEKYIAKGADAIDIDSPISHQRAPMACVHATCWNGKNATNRYMNMLSPSMSNDKFNSYLNAMKERGVDTVHLLLMNKADGECANYSIYGTGGTGAVNKDTLSHMLARLKIFRNEGLRIVLWGVADDSNDWANAMLSNPAKYVSDLKTTGILDFADIFVLGLEMDEYGTREGWEAFAKALHQCDRSLYLATHHTSGTYTYASLGSGVMGQLAPKCSTSDIKNQIAKIKSLGKDAWGFEYSRGPDRSKAVAALLAGAKGVGNW